MAHAHSGGTWFGRPSVNLLSYFVLYALPVFGGYSRIPFGHPEKGDGISPEASLGATFPCPAQGGTASIGRTRRPMWQYRESIFVAFRNRRDMTCQSRRDVACHVRRQTCTAKFVFSTPDAAGRVPAMGNESTASMVNHIARKGCHALRKGHEIISSWLCAPRMRGTVPIAYGLAHRYRRPSIHSGSRRESGHLRHGAATPMRGPQGSCCDG